MPATKPRPSVRDMHISGAEGICSEDEIRRTVQEYVNRAMTHPRGRPDTVVITVEQLTRAPKLITALPVMTLKCGSPLRAETLIRMLLETSGVAMKAIAAAMQLLRSSDTMRGAGLLLASSGRRVEPDMQRGVRASRFGIDRHAEKALSRELGRLGIDTQTVREALVLASKVASCRDVVAEVCISDDPDYTTGYVSSRTCGYVRIPHVKKKRDRRGGRVFFLKETASPDTVVQYLEKRPVLITATARDASEDGTDETPDCHHQ